MNEETLHDRRVASVVTGVSKLALLPQMSPEAVFEGAVKGAAIVMLSATASSATEVASLLREMAAAIENGGKPKLAVVK